MSEFAPGAPAPCKPSFSKTAHDKLALPTARDLGHGREIGAVETGELYRIFDAIGLAGFSHSLGRAQAVELYAAHLQRIHDFAGGKAITEYLAKRNG